MELSFIALSREILNIYGREILLSGEDIHLCFFL